MPIFPTTGATAITKAAVLSPTIKTYGICVVVLDVYRLTDRLTDRNKECYRYLSRNRTVHRTSGESSTYYHTVHLSHESSHLKEEVLVSYHTSERHETTQRHS